MPLQQALEFSKTERKKGAQYYIQLGRLFWDLFYNVIV